MLAVVYSRIPFRRSVETRRRSSERRWSVMSIPVLMMCVIAPSPSSRQVLDHAISRASPRVVIHSRSEETGNVSGRIAANSRLTVSSVPSGASTSQVRAAEHVLRRAAGQALARAVEREDRAFAVEDEDERPGRVDAGGEDVALGLQRGLGRHPLGHVGGHAEEARDRAGRVVLDGDGHRDPQPAAVLAHERPLPGLLALAPRDGDEDLVAGLDAELRGALADLGAVEEQPGRRDADDLLARGSRACVRRRG